jgi:hypothetical protein
MVKIFSNSHVFKFDWESVSNVWWQKYPNMHNLTIQAVDTIDREITDDGSLVMRRLISASMALPSWVRAVGFPSTGYVLEESRINPRSREMTVRSVNVAMDSIITIQETCVYTPDEERPTEWTKYEQTAEFTSFVPIVQSGLEGFTFSVQASNATKGLQAMEELCDRWRTEGVDGFQRVLTSRLDTILLMSNIDQLKAQLAAL